MLELWYLLCVIIFELQSDGLVLNKHLHFQRTTVFKPTTFCFGCIVQVYVVLVDILHFLTVLTS